jgi:hypothetical protein
MLRVEDRVAKLDEVAWSREEAKDGVGGRVAGKARRGGNKWREKKWSGWQSRWQCEDEVATSK